MSKTQDDIFDAAIYSGWKVRDHDDGPDGVIFIRGVDWVTVLWTRSGTVRRLIVERRISDAEDSPFEVIEDTVGREKATRAQSILWSTNDITPDNP